MVRALDQGTCSIIFIAVVMMDCTYFLIICFSSVLFRHSRKETQRVSRKLVQLVLTLLQISLLRNAHYTLFNGSGPIIKNSCSVALHNTKRRFLLISVKNVRIVA